MTKRVLIVGGNTGIGAALNEQLLAEGVETILISRNQGGVDVPVSYTHLTLPTIYSV